MAERIAKNRGLSRADVDAFALSSQQKAKAAREEGRFKREILRSTRPHSVRTGQPTGDSILVDQDQGIRDSTAEGLAALKSILEDGIHTAGNSSQISDGAAAVLYMSKEKAEALGLKPRARVLFDVLVGTDPYFLLDGPIDATDRIEKKSGMSIRDDIDLYEINEAFAAVVLSWRASRTLICRRSM